MRSQSKQQTATLLLLLLTIIVATTVFAMRSEKQEPVSNSKREQKKRTLPVVDFDAPLPTDKALRLKRETKSRRYDKYSGTPIRESPHISTRISSSHWADDVPAIPISESDVILIGTVTSAEAHISNDRTAVYSEFGVVVELVLKNQADSVVPGASVTVERYGGAVRFRSGSMQTYETAGQGMPLAGNKYVLFLKRTGSDGAHRILTAYEIGGSTVSPLDGAAVEDGTREWVFDQYKGQDVSTFLQKVRDGITKAGN